jgi:hypothetical protein
MMPRLPSRKPDHGKSSLLREHQSSAEIRVIEHGTGPRGYATIALARCPLGTGDGSVEDYHHPSSEGTFRAAAPEISPIHRWIEA